jgi:hypothetical protein
MRKSLFVLLIAFALPLAAQINETKSMKKKATTKITMAEAKKAALAKQAGTVKSSELENEEGKLVYSFDIQTKDGIHEVQIDANTGDVVSDKMEAKEDEAKEKAAEKKTQHKKRTASKEQQH